MKTEFRVTERFENLAGTAVKVHHRLVHNAMSELAVHLIERWGIVAAMPDGEDSSGRAKMRVLTPAEVVTRACDTAGIAFSEFKRRDWLTVLPSLDEIEKIADEAKPKSR